MSEQTDGRPVSRRAQEEIDRRPRSLEHRVAKANALIRSAYTLLDWGQPVGCVQWVHIDRVRCNDYNPNAVAIQEMRLLYVSIEQDGYTQPVVAIEDEARPGSYVIVDGFHRYTVMRRYPDIAARTHGYLPVVVIDKPIADRMASTIRHNRARGKHSIAGMGNLVFQMLQAGEDDASICNKVGLEPSELARLKHITGYSKLYAHVEYQRPDLNETQIRAKAAYARAHPDEVVPSDF